MKSQVLHTVWCNISGEAAGEISHWLAVKGLSCRNLKTSNVMLCCVRWNSFPGSLVYCLWDRELKRVGDEVPVGYGQSRRERTTRGCPSPQNERRWVRNILVEVKDPWKTPGTAHCPKNTRPKYGRFRKHNATPNRDMTCLGMAWARLPVNREVASAWPSQRK